MTAEPTPRPTLRALETPDEEADLQAQLSDAQHALMDVRIRCQDLEKDMASMRRRYYNLQKQISDERKADPLYEVAYKIWEYWSAKLHPQAYVFSEKAEACVLARLKEKKKNSDEPAWSARYICEAIVGAVAEAYVSPNGKRHDSLELICRDADKLYDFHGRYERWKQRQGT